MKQFHFRGKTEYPAAIKFAYAAGIENLIVPPAVQQQIGRSTRAAWRSLDQNLWRQYYDIEVDLLDLLQLLKKGDQAFVSRRMLRHAYRAAISFRQILGEDRFFRLVRKNKKGLIRLVDQVKEVFGLRAALRFFGITNRQYRDWKIELQFPCSESIHALCVKRHSNQLQAKEIKLIEQSLNDLAYAHWPLSAIHDQLRLEGKLFICRSTFYKYAALINGGNMRRQATKRKRKGLRASKVNEVWHIDISVTRTKDGQKAYLYLLVDNYSRYIIDYKVSTLASNKYIVGNMVLDAFKDLDPDRVRLISDKGVENKNHFVKDLFREFAQVTGKQIHHQIAQEDIQSSNSMIERVFRIIKGDYLYRQEVENLACLKQLMAEVIYEYNHIRPHQANLNNQN